MEIKRVFGPRRQNGDLLWEARVEIVEWDKDDGHFRDERAIRHLFLSRQPQKFEGERDLHLPGTMLALCRIEEFKLYLDSEYEWNATSGGDEKICQTLLLLQTKPDRWRKVNDNGEWLEFPDSVCLAGEIELSRLKPKQTGAKWRKNFPQISISAKAEDAKLIADASGLTFAGETRFDWMRAEETAIRGVFRASVPFAEEEISLDKTLRVTLDRELMLAAPQFDKFDAEFKKFARAFESLAAMLRRRPAAADSPEDDEKIKHFWASIEPTNRTGIPKFFWTMTVGEPSKTRLGFEGGEWTLNVADQPPGDDEISPRGLLTLAPALTLVKSATTLTVSFEENKSPEAPATPLFKLAAERGASEWSESIALTNLETEYDAAAIADALRRQHNLPFPEDAALEDSPAILWGFAPLADGWAQLPFLNLTEQIYFDALNEEGAAQPKTATEKLPLLTGAATFGNDAPEIYRPALGEQAWSATLLGGSGYQGSWTINLNTARLEKYELKIFQPDVVLNGFLWLGTEPPSAANALPSLDEWLTALRRVALRTVRPEEDFPAPFSLRFEKIDFKNRFITRDADDRPETREQIHFSLPELLAWSFSYEARNLKPKVAPAMILLEALLRRGFWKRLDAKEQNERIEEFWRYKPLVWRSHPQTPAIQNLPLTQTLAPPVFPSPSRHLAPFELPVKKTEDDKIAIPNLWKFGVLTSVSPSNAAMTWASWLAPGAVGEEQEWRRAKDLYLAALGFPGLIFDPNEANGLFETGGDFLPAQLRYSLPYTDEINALAQSPKDDDQPQAVSTARDAAPVKPARALRREDYFEFWKTLGEKAHLAAPDADRVLAKKAAQTILQNLIEPLKFPVAARLELANYPGRVIFSDAHDPQKKIEMSGATALRGIHGRFSDDGIETAAAKYEITAGSLAAHGDGKRLRDQRGLWRAATGLLPTDNPENPLFLVTDLQRAGHAPENFKLYTLRRPVNLKIGDAGAWEFWFHDLPASGDNPAAAGQTFLRKNVRDEATAEDVNDPSATASRLSPLQSYEWRLSETDDEEKPENAPLKLFGFDFFPLTLEKVNFKNAAIESIEINGRMQLPASEPTEKPETGNVVRLTFAVTFTADEQALKLIAVSDLINDQDADDKSAGIWTLGNETDDFVPRLHWKEINFPNAAGKIEIQAALEFHLFEARWLLDYKPIEFTKASDLKLLYAAKDLKETGDDNIRFERVEVLPPTDQAGRKIIAEAGFRWGAATTALKLKSLAVFDLLDAKNNPVSSLEFYRIVEKNGKKIEQTIAALEIENDAPLAPDALQIEIGKITGGQNYHLLPGMRLVADECRGFAAMSFTVDAADEDGETSRLRMIYGAAETLFRCDWGKFLQNDLPDDAPTADRERQFFGSSAGDLIAGYTLGGAAGGIWNSSLSFNGMIEVKNLISYPRIGRLPENLSIVLFEQFSKTLPNPSPISEIADFLKREENKDLHLSLEGHTDDTDEQDDNLSFSLGRANAVRAALIAEGISGSRLTSVGFGEVFPRDSNATDTGSANNRRVELHPHLTELPAARRAAGAVQPPLDHVRHTIRVLLNQHEIPFAALAASPDNSRNLFDFTTAGAWQFVAVVEHQIADVAFDPANATPTLKLETERRWTVVQEVRFAAPQKFSDYLLPFFGSDGKRIRGTFPADEDLDLKTKELSRISAAFHYKPFLRLLKLKSEQNEILKLKETLLVEASAVYQIVNRPLLSGDLTNLQYLPQGIQQAILSIPEDFSKPADSRQTANEMPPAPACPLLTLPFLGRLQTAEKDFEMAAGNSFLQVDPLLYIARQRRTGATALALLPRVFASRGDATAEPVKISLFDAARFRSFKRLDPNTVEESWFRLHYPPKEKDLPGEKLPSVTAAFPSDSPARLSRAAMLNNLFVEHRRSFPPSSIETPDELKADDALGWRNDNLLVAQGYSDLMRKQIDEDENDSEVAKRPYAFYFGAAQIYSSFSASARFAAATLLPANLKTGRGENFQPVSLAVSPYLGIENLRLPPLPAMAKPLLVFAELLCLDRTGRNLTAVGSRVWEQEEIVRLPRFFERDWGREIHSRLAEDSALAILRVRRVFVVDLGANRQTVRAAYDFSAIKNFLPPLAVLRGTSPLRLSFDKLRFAEGNYGGNRRAPEFKNFEIAPPQISGAQAIYLDPETADAGQAELIRSLGWKWGLSAMRFAVRFADEERGISGAVSENSKRLLWWFGAAHRVQYAPPRNGNFLPANFRAPFIRSLSPSAVNLPLPDDLEEFLKDVGEKQSEPAFWQSVLPGSLNCWFVGARAGVPFEFRYSILQQVLTDARRGRTAIASGSIPVQHRFPRPVALPKNPQNYTDFTEAAPVDALQTWAWIFEPQKVCSSSPQPIDNAVVVKDKVGENKIDAHGLSLTLVNPPNATISPGETAEIEFEIHSKQQASEVENWEIKVELTNIKRNLELKFLKKSEGRFIFRPAVSKEDPTAEENIDKSRTLVREFLADLSHGEMVWAVATLTPPAGLINLEGYTQTLRFPLHFVQPDRQLPPFRFEFAQFEDAEYNRRLTTQAAQTLRLISYKKPDGGNLKNTAELIFAADRRDYNPTSDLLLGFFNHPHIAAAGEKLNFGKLSIKRIDRDGNENSLHDMEILIAPRPNETVVQESRSGLQKYSLRKLAEEAKIKLEAGDTLLISWLPPKLSDVPDEPLPPPLELRVEIVSRPVTPAPTAAYALLRKEINSETAQCARFAWSPAASRVELLNPMDLSGGLVRRRAIFQWFDVVRCSDKTVSSIQKITPTGSSHW